MKLHQLQGHIQSIYLVEYPDKLMLLDGGCRADVGMLCAFICKQLKRQLTDLKLIVVTHMHPDHAGGAQRLRSLCSCKIIASSRSKHWYGSWDGWLMYLSDLALTRWVAKRQGKKHMALHYQP